MNEVRYSLDEIDRMRKAIDKRRWARTVCERYVPDNDDTELRTLMMNGTRPEEVEESADKEVAKSQETHDLIESRLR